MNLVDYELSNDEDSDEGKSNSSKKEKDLKEIENLCNKNLENEKTSFKIKEVDNKKPNNRDAKNDGPDKSRNVKTNLYNDNDKDESDKHNDTSKSGHNNLSDEICASRERERSVEHNYNMTEEEKLKNINQKIWDNNENDCNTNILEKNNIMNINVDENNFDEIFYLPENKYSEILNKKIDELSKLYDINLTINKNIINSNEYKNPCILEKIMEMFDIDVYSSNYPSHIYNPHDFLSVDLFNEKENPTDRNKAKSKWSEMM
ncbi:HCNGP-like protein, putative [Plasmodium chabaudi chabaudi]|uniref:HCNGP-like protein, putative n=1 Tax=Plasmodium chabaudi chabaudi TaxID=31271 RepID=A0A077TKD0_PLACU|nr:HCNGP-like protein, putative [Plasmodium chabaudi chabaudi]SCN60797.1 HCNGP-like protein, putative [Plasmodium chabaudi chabaudi]VTZ69012.1 HCNGP-like protein, putative [Plasmodium chabaudi chabaudi]|eukprot:XP_016653904.1 HCNGP-like protein, putative [Plasmodium chabaudi chabaudi]